MNASHTNPSIHLHTAHNPNPNPGSVSLSRGMFTESVINGKLIRADVLCCSQIKLAQPSFMKHTHKKTTQVGQSAAQALTDCPDKGTYNTKQ